MDARTVGESILLRGCRFGDPRLPATEVWFIITDHAEGTRLKEIFPNAALPSDLPKLCLSQSYCTLIGSYLYVLGGKGGYPRLWDEDAKRVRRLDIRNPSAGWETCRPLQHNVTDPTFAVAGNLIYMFPPWHNIYRSPPETTGCVYDALEEICVKINPPPICLAGCNTLSRSRSPSFSFCFAFEEQDNRGVIAAVSGLLPKNAVFGVEEFHLYNPDKKSWKHFCNFNLPNIGMPIREHAFLNGILYLCYWDWNQPHVLLYSYDVNTGNVIMSSELPETIDLDPKTVHKRFLVAVADHQLFYLWSRRIRHQPNKQLLYLAKIKLSDVLEVQVFDFDLDAGNVLNCLLLGSNYIDENGEEAGQSNDTGIQHDDALAKREEEKPVPWGKAQVGEPVKETNVSVLGREDSASSQPIEEPVLKIGRWMYINSPKDTLYKRWAAETGKTEEEVEMDLLASNPSLSCKNWPRELVEWIQVDASDCHPRLHVKTYSPTMEMGPVTRASLKLRMLRRSRQTPLPSPELDRFNKYKMECDCLCTNLRPEKLKPGHVTYLVSVDPKGAGKFWTLGFGHPIAVIAERVSFAAVTNAVRVQQKSLIRGELVITFLCYDPFAVRWEKDKPKGPTQGELDFIFHYDDELAKELLKSTLAEELLVEGILGTTEGDTFVVDVAFKIRSTGEQVYAARTSFCTLPTIEAFPKMLKETEEFELSCR